MDIARWLSALAGLLPFGFVLGVSLLRFAQGADRARAITDAFLAWTIVSYGSTELLGRFHQIAFYPFFVLWIAANGWILYHVHHVRKQALGFWQWQNTLPFWIVAAFVLVTLFIALTTAPNNWDSQTYHLPRIEHWVQNGSLEVYPTSIMQQNETGPLAETLLLQTRVLSGSDFFYPLVQWVSMLCSIAAVFRITRQLGGSDTQCWIAAVFLATLPIGVLESTSTQTDYVVAALLTCFVTLGLETITQSQPSLRLVLAATAAAALSGIAKPIGYLIGSGFALWFGICLSRRVALAEWFSRVAGVVVVLALVMAPFATRYIGAGGTQSDLSKYITNGSFGVKQTLDNFIRDAMLNFNTGIPQIDTFTNGAIETITSRMGLDTYRQDTSELGHPFSRPPVGFLIFHEDHSPNPVHSILVIVALVMTVIRWPARASPLQFYYWGAWLIGVVVFATILRWNPFQTRYHLPAFALVAPVVAMAWPQRWSHSRKTAALFLILALTGLPDLLLNQARALIPLSRDLLPPGRRDRPSYLTQSSLERLFVNQPQLLAPYRDAVEVIVRSNASQIGLVLGVDSWEYPIWSMLGARKLDHPVRIEHVALPRASRYPLGPFVPDVLFWNEYGEAPPTFTLDGREFVRVGPPSTIAAYVRPALALAP